MEKLNLQLFAEGIAEGQGKDTAVSTEGAAATELKTYTEEELQARPKEQAEQSKADLDAEKARWLEELETKRKEDEAEAEKLAKLSDAEREKVKLDK